MNSLNSWHPTDGKYFRSQRHRHQTPPAHTRSVRIFLLLCVVFHPLESRCLHRCLSFSLSTTHIEIRRRRSTYCFCQNSIFQDVNVGNLFVSLTSRDLLKSVSNFKFSIFLCLLVFLAVSILTRNIRERNRKKSNNYSWGKEDRFLSFFLFFFACLLAAGWMNKKMFRHSFESSKPAKSSRVDNENFWSNKQKKNQQKNFVSCLAIHLRIFMLPPMVKRIFLPLFRNSFPSSSCLFKEIHFNANFKAVFVSRLASLPLPWNSCILHRSFSAFSLPEKCDGRKIVSVWILWERLDVLWRCVFWVLIEFLF